ncbi:hypothetical protein ASPFODRAFT_47793 [Aspergillus luchuensis CBS 106.47]|uniref:Uncharacterized protein n=1 Tax=Aspergillus luchuensis (strain CBS 106.47) TaxID=1137211 RepID=A0A1M3TEV3_ASPLC|nr:hypothetical protein ASPFODRAFT_47793 [Aspergillus luchuensis CBS 106.47]
MPSGPMSKTSRRHSNHSTEEKRQQRISTIFPAPGKTQQLIRTKSDSVVLVT